MSSEDAIGRLIKEVLRMNLSRLFGGQLPVPVTFVDDEVHDNLLNPTPSHLPSIRSGMLRDPQGRGKFLFLILGWVNHPTQYQKSEDFPKLRKHKMGKIGGDG